MKKIFFFTLSLSTILGFTACQSEQDDLFDTSAAERLSASKVTYTERLPQATAGWAMEFYPTNSGSAPRGSGYLMLAQFSSNKSVRIAMQDPICGLFDGYSGDDYYYEDTSLWEVISDQGPVLSFNTYNDCLHYFANPAIYETGLGYEGDYEFEIISLEDHAQFAMLKGKKRGTYVRLSRLDDGTDFHTYLTDVRNFEKSILAPSAPNDFLLVIGKERYIVFDYSDNFLYYYPEGGDMISEEQSVPYLITKRGDNYYLRFRDAFKRDSIEGTLQELRYDKQQDTFVGVENADFKLMPLPAEQFFFDNMAVDGNVWQMSVAADKSDDIKTVIQQMQDELKASKTSYEIDGNNDNNKLFTMRMADDKLFLDFTVKFRRSNKNYTSTLTYAYTIEKSDNGITMSYDNSEEGGTTDGAKTFYDTFPSVKTFVDLFSDQFTVAGVVSNFDLTTVKLTSVNTPSRWMLMRFAYN